MLRAALQVGLNDFARGEHLMPAAILSAALKLPATPREADATAAVARYLTGLSYSVWGNGYNSLRGAGIAQYDLGWGPAGATEPSVLLQMKSGGAHQEDQSVLELLNDILYAAYDNCQNAGTGQLCYIATVLHAGDLNRNYWPHVAALTGRCVLSLTPTAAKVKHGAEAATWIDPVARMLKPYTRTQFGQIFSGTQKAKYVGLFARAGTLAIEFDAQVIATGEAPHSFNVLLWKVIDAQLTGTALPLHEWLP